MKKILFCMLFMLIGSQAFAQDAASQKTKYYSEAAMETLANNGVSDPDMRLFIGIFRDDLSMVKSAVASGADINITDTELLKRYASQLTSPSIEKQVRDMEVVIAQRHQNENKIYFSCDGSMDAVTPEEEKNMNAVEYCSVGPQKNDKENCLKSYSTGFKDIVKCTWSQHRRL